MPCALIFGDVADASADADVSNDGVAEGAADGVGRHERRAVRIVRA